MEDKPSRKRSFPEEDDDHDESTKPPAQKRVRFPKGKKVKPGEQVVDLPQDNEDDPIDLADSHRAAKERAVRRNLSNVQDLSEDSEMLHDISAAEMQYEDNETFIDDGIQIDPFNLTKEREEGYFDAAGNYVEYINDNEIKDAWLDSVDVEPKLAERISTVTNVEENISELSSQEIGKMKRRIADALEPGETVLRALRRLKGTSSNKKEKMSAETKLLFDQLTEDAMKLMENGDYNVYDEKQDVFEREAEGYERLVQARGEGTSLNSGQGKLDSTLVPSKNDGFDMFAEDDGSATTNQASDGSEAGPGPSQTSESGDLQNDYVYDESSGYYYSSSLGYYYDPLSGLYCCASSGQWYSYNEETVAYDEIQGAAFSTS